MALAFVDRLVSDFRPGQFSPIPLVLVWSLASVQLVGNLATHAGATASGSHAVAEGAALDVVLVPDVTAHDE